MIEVHNSSVKEDEEGRHIFTPRARRIMKSCFGGFSALVAGIVILIHDPDPLLVQLRTCHGEDHRCSRQGQGA